jgi:hypothetical protein
MIGLRLIILASAGGLTFLAYLAVAALLFGFSVSWPLMLGCSMAGVVLGLAGGILLGR